jgi:hypothetical protein
MLNLCQFIESDLITIQAALERNVKFSSELFDVYDIEYRSILDGENMAFFFVKNPAKMKWKNLCQIVDFITQYMISIAYCESKFNPDRSFSRNIFNFQSIYGNQDERLFFIQKINPLRKFNIKTQINDDGNFYIAAPQKEWSIAYSSEENILSIYAGASGKLSLLTNLIKNCLLMSFKNRCQQELPLIHEFKMASSMGLTHRSLNRIFSNNHNA